MRTSLSHRPSVHISHSHPLLRHFVIQNVHNPNSIIWHTWKQAPLFFCPFHVSNTIVLNMFWMLTVIWVPTAWRIKTPLSEPWWSFNPGAKSHTWHLLLHWFANRWNFDPSEDSVEEKYDNRKVKLMVFLGFALWGVEIIYSCSNRYY